MSKVIKYFSTDLSAMTANDYFGVIFSVVTALVMVGAYWYAFSPKNKEKFIGDGKIPFNEDRKVDTRRSDNG